MLYNLLRYPEQKHNAAYRSIFVVFMGLINTFQWFMTLARVELQRYDSCVIELVLFCSYQQHATCLYTSNDGKLQFYRLFENRDISVVFYG